MKYNVTCSCGHETVVELFGKGSDREREIRRIELGVCPACRAKENAAKDAAAAEQAKELGFPALTGSEKQVAWAESIRMRFYKTACEAFEIETEEQRLAAQKLISNVISGMTSAAEWIESRDDKSGIGLLRKYAGK